jgi:hypothetical protein
LDFDDAPEDAAREGVRGMMEKERNAATVRMPVVTMAAFLALQLEAISL